MAKRPRMSVADISWLRGMVIDSQEVESLRRMAHRKVEALRVKLVRRIADALYTRYRRYTRNDEAPPSFALWLMNKTMKQTYLFHSHEMRQYWSARPIGIAALPRLNHGNEEEDKDWYYRLLEHYLNLKDPNGFYYITVSPFLDREGMDEDDEEGSPSVAFFVDIKALVSGSGSTSGDGG